MAVLDPLRVVIENYPEGQTETVSASNHPKNPQMGQRSLSFSRTLYIERSDFMEVPARKFFRLAPGREVRLRYAYYITCTDVVKNDQGEVIEIHCTYDPATKGGSSPDGRKVKGTIHWVSAEHAVNAEIRLYDRLFLAPNPAAKADFLEHLNPESMIMLTGCKLEPSLLDIQPEARFQFERQGYFCADREDHSRDHPVFNRTVTLRDTWAKIEKSGTS